MVKCGGNHNQTIGVHRYYDVDRWKIDETTERLPASKIVIVKDTLQALRPILFKNFEYAGFFSALPVFNIKNRNATSSDFGAKSRI